MADDVAENDMNDAIRRIALARLKEQGYDLDSHEIYRDDEEPTPLEVSFESRLPHDADDLLSLVAWGERVRLWWRLERLIPPCWMAHRWGIAEFAALREIESGVLRGEVALGTLWNAIEGMALRIERQWASPCTASHHIPEPQLPADLGQSPDISGFLEETLRQINQS
jgi:hypothetical protein